MIEKINDLIDMLEECAKLLWMARTDQFKSKFEELIPKLFETVPQIIISYSDERLSDIKDDALYWPEQVNKIIGIVDSGCDTVALTDAIYHELRANLIDYKETLISRKMMG